VQDLVREVQPLGRSAAEASVGQWSIDELRSSRLGQDLVDIAHFAEGIWPQTLATSIEPVVKRVYQALFGNSLSTSEVHLPRHFHRTPLGLLISQANALLYQEEDLLSPGSAWRQLDVARQTIYDWVEEGKLTPVHLNGQMMLLRREVEVLKAQRSRQQIAH
jgi:hypothetical protein